MFIDVLNRVAADAGYHPTQQRAALVKLLNFSARDIYNKLECNRIYRECTLAVPRNKIVSIPSIVGDLRGMRAHYGDYPFDLKALMTPRYISGTWNYRYCNWRDLGESPVLTYVGSVDVLTIVSPVLEGTTISITGQTANAARIQEDLLLDSSPKSSVTEFGPTIFRIACATDRTCDITIKDIAGTTIAVLYNNEKQTRYRIVDVSEIAWSIDTAADETLVDIAFKIPLGVLSNDADSFPAGDDYDEAWYCMAMHLHYKPMKGMDVQASDAFKYAMLALNAIKSGTDDNTVQKVSFGRNKFYNLFWNRYYYGTLGSCTRETPST